MKKWILTCLVGLLALSCTRDYMVKPVKGKSTNDELYNFPLLEGGNAEVCYKINNKLTESYLNLQLGEEKESLFENVWSTDLNSLPERTDIDFKVCNLDQKIYSVNITGLYIGAYMSEIDEYRNFDLKTGNEIDLDTLFTKVGSLDIQVQLSRFKEKLLKEKIAFAKEMLSKEALSIEERKYYSEMYDLYENCSPTVESLTYVSFYIKEDSLHFLLESCALNYNKMADEIGNFRWSQPKNYLKSKLSPYGKQILN